MPVGAHTLRVHTSHTLAGQCAHMKLGLSDSALHIEHSPIPTVFLHTFERVSAGCHGVDSWGRRGVCKGPGVGRRWAALAGDCGVCCGCAVLQECLHCHGANVAVVYCVQHVLLFACPSKGHSYKGCTPASCGLNVLYVNGVFKGVWHGSGHDLAAPPPFLVQLNLAAPLPFLVQLNHQAFGTL